MKYNIIVFVCKTPPTAMNLLKKKICYRSQDYIVLILYLFSILYTYMMYSLGTDKLFNTVNILNDSLLHD